MKEKFEKLISNSSLSKEDKTFLIEFSKLQENAVLEKLLKEIDNNQEILLDVANMIRLRYFEGEKETEDYVEKLAKSTKDKN